MPHRYWIWIHTCAARIRRNPFARPSKQIKYLCTVSSAALRIVYGILYRYGTQTHTNWIEWPVASGQLTVQLCVVIEMARPIAKVKWTL